MKTEPPVGVVLGIFFVVLACACFAVLDTTTKFVALSVPVLVAVWVRYVVQATLSSLVLLPMHGWQVMRTSRLRLQLLRGLLLITSATMAVYSLTSMPLGEFTAIVMTTPLVVTVLAVVFLKERITVLHWCCVLGGWLVFGQLPDGWSWAGMGLIAATGTWGAWLSVREKTAIATLPET